MINNNDEVKIIYEEVELNLKNDEKKEIKKVKKSEDDPRRLNGGAIDDQDKPTVERLTYLEKVANKADEIVKDYFCFTMKGDWWYFEQKEGKLPEWINLSEIYSEAKLNGILVGHYLKQGGKRLDTVNNNGKEGKERDSDVVRRVFFEYTLEPKKIDYRTIKACFLNFWLDEDFEKKEYSDGKIYMPNMIPFNLLSRDEAIKNIKKEDFALLQKYLLWAFSQQKIDDEEEINNQNIEEVFAQAEKSKNDDVEVKYEFNESRYKCVMNYIFCSVVNHNFGAFYLFGSEKPRTGKTTFSFTIPMNISPNGIKPIPRIAIIGSQNAKFDLTGFEGYTLGVCQELGEKISSDTIENLKEKHETGVEYLQNEDKNRNQSKRYNIGKFAATTQFINAEWKYVDDAIKSRFVFVHMTPNEDEGRKFSDKIINKLLKKKEIIEWIIAESYAIFIENWKNNDDGSRADIMRFGCEDTNLYFANVTQREEFIVEEFNFDKTRIWKKYVNTEIANEIKIWNSEFKDDYDDYKNGDLNYQCNLDNKKPKYQVSKQSFMFRFFSFLKLKGFEKTKINNNLGRNPSTKEVDRFNVFIKKR